MEAPRMNRILMAASWIACSALTASGQATTGTPEFEVASVKPADKQARDQFRNVPGPVAEMMGFEGGPGTKDPGRIFYHGVSLKMVLARAYNMRPEQISGPSWLGSERYTIEAKLPPGTDAEGLRSMLQKLLIERFQLSVHKEVKDTPVYRLKVAKNGPKLEPARAVPQYETDDERQDALMKRVEAMRAATKANQEKGIRTPGRSFGLARATTGKFAETLAGHLDRPVKDMTQLEGEYSFRLAYDPDGGMREDGLSIFTAIQEQLGLRLEAGNEPIELLVIDKVEKVPVSN
jgi:uncharacterized protein (TIGR03435 family)